MNEHTAENGPAWWKGYRAHLRQTRKPPSSVPPRPRPIPPAKWDDDPNHPEGIDCHGEPLSSGERCARDQHTPYVGPPEGTQA